jgi:hypothetical protein
MGLIAVCGNGLKFDKQKEDKEKSPNFIGSIIHFEVGM